MPESPLPSLNLTSSEVQVLSQSPAALKLLLDWHEMDSSGAEALEAVDVVRMHEHRVSELIAHVQALESARRRTAGTHASGPVCPSCESTAVIETQETSTFEYGSPVSVPLTVTQPVLTCMACHECWTDHRGEQAREASVARYLEVLGGAAREREVQAQRLARSIVLMLLQRERDARRRIRRAQRQNLPARYIENLRTSENEAHNAAVIARRLLLGLEA